MTIWFNGNNTPSCALQTWYLFILLYWRNKTACIEIPYFVGFRTPPLTVKGTLRFIHKFYLGLYSIFSWAVRGVKTLLNTVQSRIQLTILLNCGHFRKLLSENILKLCCPIFLISLLRLWNGSLLCIIQGNLYSLRATSASISTHVLILKAIMKIYSECPFPWLHSI